MFDGEKSPIIIFKIFRLSDRKMVQNSFTDDTRYLFIYFEKDSSRFECQRIANTVLIYSFFVCITIYVLSSLGIIEGIYKNILM